MTRQTARVCGGGGFIGSHLVNRLGKNGIRVRRVEVKYLEFPQTVADDFVIADLRDQSTGKFIRDRRFDEIYPLAADMGGPGFFLPAITMLLLAGMGITDLRGLSFTSESRRHRQVGYNRGKGRV